jgi:integrase
MFLFPRGYGTRQFLRSGATIAALPPRPPPTLRKRVGCERAVPIVALTTALVTKLSCSSSHLKMVVRDRLTPGLSLEVRASGGKTWYCSYTSLSGKRRQLRLGHFPGLTLSQARRAASETRLQASMGHDLCQQVQRRRCEPSLAAFVLDTYLPHIQASKRSWRDDLTILKLYILPRFGQHHLSELSSQEVCQWRSELLARGFCAGTANRYLSTLRHLYSTAVRLGRCQAGSHPFSQVSPLPDSPNRQQCLTQESLGLLLQALRQSQNKQLLPICTLLLLTGARKREVLDARWEAFDLARQLWTIPMTKSGRSLAIPLSAAACSLLASLQKPSRSGGYVFPNPLTGVPFTSVFSSWHQARCAAGLPRLRMHDLRHSFASQLINSGCSLYTVQRLLGHSSPRVTQRYATLTDRSLLEASEQAAAWLAGAQDACGSEAPDP